MKRFSAVLDPDPTTLSTARLTTQLLAFSNQDEHEAALQSSNEFNADTDSHFYLRPRTRSGVPSAHQAQPQNEKTRMGKEQRQQFLSHRHALRDDIDSELKPCPHVLESIDKLLTCSNGGPTWLFVFAQVCCAVQVPHVLAGTFFSPSIVTLMKGDDRLMALVLGCMAAMLGVVNFILRDLRQVIRPNGPLCALGVGSRLLRAKQHAKVEASVHKFHIARTPQKLKTLVPTAALIAVLVYPRIGIYSDWWNRASAVLLWMWYVVCNTGIALWIISMNTATVLSSDAVDQVSIAIASTSKDMSKWGPAICAPAIALHRSTMSDLSRGWGKTVVVYCVCCLLGTVGVFSLAISPHLLQTYHAAWFPLALRCGCTCGGLMFTTLPIFIASGPARVSSACKELMVTLNQCRLDSLLESRSQEIHAQITVLEVALSKLNDGQGLGFLVAGIVIDKGKLIFVSRMIGALVVTVGPVLVAWGSTWSTAGSGNIATKQGQMCALSAAQKQAIVAFAESSPRSTCVYNTNNGNTSISISFSPAAGGMQ